MTNSIKEVISGPAVVGFGGGGDAKAPYETKTEFKNTCLASLAHPSQDLQQLKI